MKFNFEVKSNEKKCGEETCTYRQCKRAATTETIEDYKNEAQRIKDD